MTGVTLLVLYLSINEAWLDAGLAAGDSHYETITDNHDITITIPFDYQKC